MKTPLKIVFLAYLTCSCGICLITKDIYKVGTAKNAFEEKMLLEKSLSWNEIKYTSVVGFTFT